MSQKQFNNNNNNDPNNINSISIDNSKQDEDYKINLNERLPICGVMGLKGICKRRGKCPAHPRQKQQQHTSFLLQLPNPTTTATNTSTSTSIINKPRVIKNPKKFEKKIQQLYDFTNVIRLYKFQNDIQDDQLIQDIVQEYIRFMLLKTINSDTCSNETDYKISLAPPTLIERFWYSHLSHTEEYKKYCGMFVGAFITCDPEINSEPLELQMLRFKTTLSLYILYFDNNVNTKIWDYQDKASPIE